MADDRMKHDDAQRQMGNKDDQDFARQSPGRGGQMGQQGGQQSGGQQQGAQKGARNLNDDDDELNIDTGKSGGQNRGGQNR